MAFTLLIKNYHNGGGDLTIELLDAAETVKTVGSVLVPHLVIRRKPDKYSSRLTMFANIRNTKPGYHSLGFPQLLLTLDTYTSSKKLLARYLTYFYDVAVRSVLRIGDEEEITFIAREKSPAIATSNIVLVP